MKKLKNANIHLKSIPLICAETTADMCGICLDDFDKKENGGDDWEEELGVLGKMFYRCCCCRSKGLGLIIRIIFLEENDGEGEEDRQFRAGGVNK